ncbi:protein IQ-DOMAIN 31-like protein [Cinnamomum micranthum f. kanehirae]|uniref:Protein IQ-DOMAIN 31-like protein n=1 Tax=Cinnamomum micranthum f. kanehirae TaxID=337451 RepID=A0A3S3Q3W4_9MAGN|nr:protein IQ-DOMAIN 31-like protein [Cinnamomum micranthum f. kanehirae]
MQVQHCPKHPAVFNSGGMPMTPAKSVCGETFFQQYSNFPNYMENTQSFRAKVQFHSAPKQRPMQGPKKGLLWNEMVESRARLSGVQMRRSCSLVHGAFNFKNAVMGRLDRSTDTTSKLLNTDAGTLVLPTSLDSHFSATDY